MVTQYCPTVGPPPLYRFRGFAKNRRPVIMKTNNLTEASNLQTRSHSFLYTRHQSADIVARFDPATGAQFQQLLRQHGGPIPQVEQGSFLVKPKLPGNHFTCRHRGQPVLVGGLALHAAEAGELWTKLANLVLELPNGRFAERLLIQPEDLPWVAILALPQFSQVSAGERARFLTFSFDLADALVRFHESKPGGSQN